jgi:histidyl-tRNA synthetase
MSKRSIAPSGFPEYLPAMQIIADEYQTAFKLVASQYGYAHIETPAVEYLDTLASKGDIDKEIYAIHRAQGEGDSVEADRGLHFDLTVPFARYVAQHQNDLYFPFRRYQIQKVWRGERPQKGRFREFYQADIDVVAPEQLPPYYDAEVATVMAAVLETWQLGSMTMHISNRKFLDGLLQSFGIPMETAVLQAIDKLDKIGVEAVTTILSDELGYERSAVTDCLALISRSVGRKELSDFWAELPSENETLEAGRAELESLFNALPEDTSEGVQFVLDPRIARGLDYYTGTVYETTIDGLERYGSICSGGRYTDLVSRFSNKKLPGVGLSIGLTRLLAIAEAEDLVQPTRHSLSDVVVCLLNEEQEKASLQTAQRLREAGYRTETNHRAKVGLGKQISTAEAKGIPWALVVESDDTYTLYNIGGDKASCTSFTEVLMALEK